MFLAIDADIFLYKSLTSAETEICWGDDIWSLWSDLKIAKDVFQKQIDDVTSATGVKDFVLCLSDHGANFRKDIDPSYKSNRKGARKPIGYVQICDWARQEYRSFSKDKLEADDCLGIIATKPGNVGRCIIVSDDKDLKTIPSQLYRPMSGEKLTISEQEADKFFLTQCLTGDVTDGYSGCPKIGPKTAEKILGSRPSWSLVEQAYLKAGLTRDDAIRQARLARILRWSDWDDKKGEIRLWQP